jgi:hypothetical protein
MKSVELYGDGELKLNLERLAETTGNQLFMAMLEEAEKIRDLAREFAPVDEYNLVNAIQTDVESRDSSGRFKRKEVTVFVDMNMVNDDGTYVGDYAMLIHEYLQPYGSGDLNLGKKSQLKDAGRRVVGGKFLERAILERALPMIDRLEAVAQQHMKRTVSVTPRKKR